jgi:hypothetical protein
MDGVQFAWVTKWFKLKPIGLKVVSGRLRDPVSCRTVALVSRALHICSPLFIGRINISFKIEASSGIAKIQSGEGVWLG